MRGQLFNQNGYSVEIVLIFTNYFFHYKNLMIKISVAFTIIVLVVSVRSQVVSQESKNYYQFFTEFYNDSEKMSSNSFEQGDLTHALRNYSIWSERLYPEGDFKVAANANYNYTLNFNESNLYSVEPIDVITGEHEWEQLGPVGNNSNTPTVGQIHRITFHPDYSNNQTIYASSGFGGLWKSNSSGMQWSLMNTDNTLPFCGVADVGISSNGTTIFLATGYPDGTVYGTVQPNISSVNPLFTQGVYRSVNNGVSWEPLNKNLLENFKEGGVIRRLLCNPINDQRLIIASSRGVYFCDNSLSKDASWKKGVIRGEAINDLQLRGLAFKPGSPNVVYASGSDIYMSDNGGVEWESITGEGTGLDFKDLLKRYNKFIPDRINIAVTKLNPEILYAYVMGSERFDNKTRMFLFRYENRKWEMITTHKTVSNFDLYSQSYMAIAVSPNDENLVYWGNTIIHSTYTTDSFPAKVNQVMGYATVNGGYVDIHDLVFEPDTKEPKLFAANHGGISSLDLQKLKWSYNNVGLCNSTIWSFDDNDVYSDDIIIALQDHGIRAKQKVGGEYKWRMLNTGGDGYSARIYNDIEKQAYHSNTWRAVYNYDFKTKKIKSLSKGFPKDIPDPDSSPEIFFTNTFPCILHPDYANYYLGFSEIYSRANGHTDPKIRWSLESDIGKTIKPKWQRQITELAISKSNSNVVFLATMGVDNGSNPAAKWHLNPRLFKSETGFINGDWSRDNFKEVELTKEGTGILKTKGNVTIPPVTGIAIHPKNENVVWITFSGYSDQHKVYKSTDGGATWLNDDSNGKLVNLPVNGIAYQDGTNDRLYIATDAGVYTKSQGSDWAKFGDLPNVRVVEIKINYCSGTLKAATFGRGVFETALLNSSNTYSDLRIRKKLVWNEKKYVTNNILITKGGSLTLQDTLYMPFNGKIVVEKGGELNIENGIITNNCGKDWDGVYLLHKKSCYNARNNNVFRHQKNGLVIVP